MMICIVTVITLAYMINGYIGFVLMAGLLVWKLLIRGQLTVCSVLKYMLISLPLSYVGIMGISMHQILSWYNILLLILLFIVANKVRGKFLIDGYAGAALIVILWILMLNLFWTENIGASITEIIQIMVMLVPLLIFHKYRKCIKMSLQEIQLLISAYGDVCVATAICMLIQYVLCTFWGKVIGIVHFTGGNRVQCYVLFRGASILPIFMGSGLLIYFILLMKNRFTLSYVFKIAVVFLAMVLNSSRTGLLMVIVVAGLICIKEIIWRPGIKKILFTTLGVCSAAYGTSYLTKKRAGLSGFLDANGRFGTWMNGFEIWTADLKNFLIGEGFVGGRWTESGFSKPHNFIIQTLGQCGIIICLLVVALIIKYLIDNIGNRYIWVPIFILMSGLLVTDFYANAFTTVLFIIVDILGEIDKRTRHTYV